jgi:Leucine Rich repeat
MAASRGKRSEPASGRSLRSRIHTTTTSHNSGDHVICAASQRGFVVLVASRPVHRHIQNQKEMRLLQKYVGAEEAKQIANELTTNTTVKSLDLRSSKIGGDGAVALAGALAANKSLVRLRLEQNEIGMEALGQS